MGKLILITGGARSGKSRYAQEMAEKSGEKVLFVATAEGLDDEMRGRIAKHRQQRPTIWRTLEAPLNVSNRLQAAAGDIQTIIIDCITLLVNNVFTRGCDGDSIDMTLIQEKLSAEIDGLLDCVKKTDALFIIVTNEVGLGIVPDNYMARSYRDLLGGANQQLAKASDEVYLMVSGLPLRVK